MMVPSSSMVVVALSLFGVVSALPAGQKNSKLKSDSPYPFPYVTRAQWLGRPPTSVTPLASPAPLVLIHHSFEPAACRDRAECSRAMRLMQDYHQMHQGWADIGYNFAVGSDGVVYEARGWTTVGAHASSYNSKSIGIVLIGDWIDDGCNESQGGASSRDAVASTDRATAEHGPSTSGASVEASNGVPAGPMLPTEASQEAAIEDEAVSGEAV